MSFVTKDATGTVNCRKEVDHALTPVTCPIFSFPVSVLDLMWPFSSVQITVTRAFALHGLKSLTKFTERISSWRLNHMLPDFPREYPS